MFWILNTTHCIQCAGYHTLYTVCWIPHTAYSVLDTTHCIQCAEYHTLHTVCWIPHTAYSVLNTIHCIIDSVNICSNFTVYSVRYPVQVITVYCIPYTLYSVLYDVCVGIHRVPPLPRSIPDTHTQKGGVTPACDCSPWQAITGNILVRCAPQWPGVRKINRGGGGYNCKRGYPRARKKS